LREAVKLRSFREERMSALPSGEYWYTLEDVLTQYVKHNDNKFDYDNEGIAHRKHIIVDRIRYIGKESNNLDDNLSGIEKPDYLEYTKNNEIVKSAPRKGFEGP
jgi:hypothetical protein